MGPTKLKLSTDHAKKKDFGLATCLLNNRNWRYWQASQWSLENICEASIAEVNGSCPLLITNVFVIQSSELHSVNVHLFIKHVLSAPHCTGQWDGTTDKADRGFSSEILVGETPLQNSVEHWC